jgi:hypothetical protein
VRCPECSTVVKLLAGPAEYVTTAARPTPQSEAGPATAGAAPARARVPPDVSNRIRRELTGKEELLWVGQPLPKLVFLRNLWAFFLSVAWVVGMGVWALVMVVAAVLSGGGGHELAVALTPLGMMLFGLVSVAVPFVQLWKARRTWYILTNRRAIVWRWRLLGESQDQYQRSELVGVHRRDALLVPGAGDVIFKTTVVTTVYSHQRGSLWRSRQTTHYGFLAVDRARELERFIREEVLEPYLEKLD